MYDVGKLLVSIGYEMQAGDDWLLGFCIQKVEADIKTACNLSGIPHGMKKAAAQMMIGEFLFTKKNSGHLQGLSLDFEAAVKQISEGDTTVAYYGANTPETRLDAFIAHLMDSGKRHMASYRRLKW